ncbi:GntR family transcriptional regulator [Tistrella mobilis]|uniref:Transcriptional regulator n=1 Tax=Tistrella mobilis TaxID=171437 RepID=A0A162K0P8_9PROT|nr:GntR family transcriptional regulator [Tistrella mobilis]KYO50246.1 transcriptional regulator [Tistrella mobilis]
MAETTAERIARVLGDRIVSGELAPGTPVRQDRIAEEFEASHVPAREAFQMLKAQGLLVSEPRRGMRVAPLDAAAVQEMTEIRASLEVLALKYAVPKLNAAALERIERALIAGDEARTMAEWERANRAFHRELAAPCRMPRLIAMIEDLQLANARIILSANRSAGWRPGSNLAHRQIFEALKARDGVRAVTLLDQHIRVLERAAAPGPKAAPATPAG